MPPAPEPATMTSYWRSKLTCASDEEVGVVASQHHAAEVLAELVRVVRVMRARGMDVEEVPHHREVVEDAAAAAHREQLVGLPRAAIHHLRGLEAVLKAPLEIHLLAGARRIHQHL